MTRLRREIRWEPEADRMRVRFLLHGPLGTTQFLMQFRTAATGIPVIDSQLAQGWDVGYHSKKPTGSATEMEKCDVLKQGHCHYDGSGLQAEELGRLFLKSGEGVVWEWLEDRYDAWLMNRDE